VLRTHRHYMGLLGRLVRDNLSSWVSGHLVLHKGDGGAEEDVECNPTVWLETLLAPPSSPTLRVCIGPGPDRPGPKTEMRKGRGPRTGPDRTRNVQTGPDWTGQGPAFCLAADRVVARSAHAIRYGRAT